MGADTHIITTMNTQTTAWFFYTIHVITYTYEEETVDYIFS